MNEYYYAQSSRVKQEKEYWTQLKKLASDDDVIGFYKLYAKYLDWNNVISPDRRAIYKMANKVVELIENK